MTCPHLTYVQATRALVNIGRMDQQKPLVKAITFQLLPPRKIFVFCNGAMVSSTDRVGGFISRSNGVTGVVLLYPEQGYYREFNPNFVQQEVHIVQIILEVKESM